MQIMIHHYIDTHAHLFFSDYTDDLPAVLSRAKEAGIDSIIVPGTDVKSSREAVLLADHLENIYSSSLY